jgi:hypothetical protein
MSNDRITDNHAANFKSSLRVAYAQRKEMISHRSHSRKRDFYAARAERPSSIVSYASKKSRKPVMSIVS